MKLCINTYILKPVGDACNFRCTYCYLEHLLSNPVKSSLWNESFIERLFSFVRMFTRLTDPVKRLSFIWHGGEPLIAGTQFYEKVLKCQKNLLESGWIIENSIQTNASLLNENSINFLLSNKFQISLSYDGLPQLQDLHRRTISGLLTSGLVERVITKLIKKRVNIGLSCVITNDSLGYEKEIYYYLKNLGIRYFAILPAADEHNKRPLVNPINFAKFVVALFNVWLTDGDPNMHIREIDNWILIAAGKQGNLCAFNRSWCGLYLIIDHTGKIFLCGEYMERRSLGSIFDQTTYVLEQLLKKRRQIQLRFSKSFLRRGRCCPRHFDEKGNDYFGSADQFVLKEIKNVLKREGVKKT